MRCGREGLGVDPAVYRVSGDAEMCRDLIDGGPALRLMRPIASLALHQSLIFAQSLWLLTLAKGKPFTFLNHAIKCGDSTVRDFRAFKVIGRHPVNSAWWMQAIWRCKLSAGQCSWIKLLCALTSSTPSTHEHASDPLSVI